MTKEGGYKTVMTNANGYEFNGLTAGMYMVSEDLKPDLYQSPPFFAG